MVKKIMNRLAALVCAVASFSAFAGQMNMSEGVTPISHQIFDLHMFAIWICVGIGIVVYGVMIYAIILHRKSRGAKAANFHGNTTLEVVWTIIPFILLIILAIPATQVLSRMEDTKNADLTIKITGYQWKWQYEYLDQGIQFFSNLATPLNQVYDEAPKSPWYLLEVDKPLVVPVNQKIRFLVTSNDVIHAWWVPDLGVKRDAIPGFIHESWARIEKPGIYRGQCAELCGVNHGFMPIVVKAVSQEEFSAWVEAQGNLATINQNEPTTQETEGIIDATDNKKPKDTIETMNFATAMKEGEEQYDKYCAVCHRQDGLGMPPVFPALKGSSVAVGKSISRHIQLILTGVPGTAMQAFENQLTDRELAAIVTYERNAWNNNTGDLVQAADVAAERQNNSQEN